MSWSGWCISAPKPYITSHFTLRFTSVLRNCTGYRVYNNGIYCSYCFDNSRAGWSWCMLLRKSSSMQFTWHFTLHNTSVWRNWTDPRYTTMRSNIPIVLIIHELVGADVCYSESCHYVTFYVQPGLNIRNLSHSLTMGMIPIVLKLFIIHELMCVTSQTSKLVNYVIFYVPGDHYAIGIQSNRIQTKTTKLQWFLLFHSFLINYRPMHRIRLFSVDLVWWILLIQVGRNNYTIVSPVQHLGSI